MGMLIAVMGMIVYSWAVEADKKASKFVSARSSDTLSGEDVKLLKEKGNGLSDSDLEHQQMKN